MEDEFFEIEIEAMKIKRWLCSEVDRNPTLEVFCDASSLAMACCVFIRSATAVVGKFKVELAISKSRLAPSKNKPSIPRLELISCVMAVRLATEVEKYLQVGEMTKHYYTDSSTAFAWITRDKTWGRWVQNRVDSVRKLSKAEEWQHFPGEHNPADLPSRGCSPEKLLQLQWWEGPAWMRKEKDMWPKSKVDFDDGVIMQEMKKLVISATCQTKPAEPMDIICKHSDFNKSLRVLSYCLRYLKNLYDRVKKRKEGLIVGLQLSKTFLPAVEEISTEELEMAEERIIQSIQQSTFSGKDNSKLNGLSCFTDEKGIIRIKSQLYFAHDEFNFRCPAVLPSKNQIVKSIILAEHTSNNHAGVLVTQALLRKRFWILKGRRTVSSVISACPDCRRFTALRCVVPVAPLPLNRVKDTVAFHTTGVDLLGPLYLKGGERVWVVLYTCAVFRGVHLETTTTISTEGFIRTLRRFIGIRGRPSIIYFDNGLNFVGCNNLFAQVDWNEVSRYSKVVKIRWIFNPPTAAWWGGFWERLVGMTKDILRRNLGKKVVDMEELQTLLFEVQSVLNQRPITYMSDRHGELVSLAPAFFMRSILVGDLPEADVADSNAIRVPMW